MLVGFWDTRRRESNEGRAAASWQWPFAFHRPPVSLTAAYLAAALRRLGHQVEFSLDEAPRDASVCFFEPTAATWKSCQSALRDARRLNPRLRSLVVGEWAASHPEAPADCGALLLKGEAERLPGVFDDVLRCDAKAVQLGEVSDLDALPWPDWSPFEPERFRLVHDCWPAPTGRVLIGRPGERRRLRSPERIVAEMRLGMETYGFRSYWCGEGCLALERDYALRLVELLGRLPQPAPFSLGARFEEFPNDLLRALCGVGLVCLRLEAAAPRMDQMRQPFQPLRDDDRLVEIVALCRSLGVRTCVRYRFQEGEKYGFEAPALARYAREVDATYAEFPPGIAAESYRRRLSYWKHNAHLVWPGMGRLGGGTGNSVPAQAQFAHPSTPKPMGALEGLRTSGRLRKDAPHHRRQIRRNHG